MEGRHTRERFCLYAVKLASATGVRRESAVRTRRPAQPCMVRQFTSVYGQAILDVYGEPVLARMVGKNSSVWWASIGKNGQTIHGWNGRAIQGLYAQCGC